MILWMMLCLLWCFLPLKSYADGTKKPTEKPGDRVFLIHADELRYDQFGPVPDAQIVKGRVQFQHMVPHYGVIVPIFISNPIQ